jgi:peptidoglycan/LPS O-acetylase OafA/YrhL
MFSKISNLYEVSDPRGRIIPMEGMRGLAVALVYFVHFFDFFHGYITPDSLLFFPFYFLATIGNLGVDLFFVISDYLIYGILLKRDQSYAKFWKRRIVRIYPVFIVAYVTYVVLSWASPGFDKIGNPTIGVGLWLGLNFLLLPGIFPVRPLIMVAWSLSYEFLYYLFSPIFVGGLRMWSWGQKQRVLFIAFLYLAGYAVLLKRAGWLDKPPSWAGQLGAVAFLGLAFYVYFGINSNRLLWDGPRLLTVDYSHFLLTVPMFSAAFFLLCYQAFRPSGALAWLFSRKPLRYLGNMSYTVYLFHVLALEGVRYVAHRWTPPAGNEPGLFLIYFVLGWIAVWALSTLVFVLVEKPVSLARKKS